MKLQNPKVTLKIMSGQTMEDPVEFIDHVLAGQPGKGLAEIISDLQGIVNTSSALISYLYSFVDVNSVDDETRVKILELMIAYNDALVKYQKPGDQE